MAGVKKSEYTAIPDSSCFHAAWVEYSWHCCSNQVAQIHGHLLWAEAQFEVSQDAVNSRIKHFNL